MIWIESAIYKMASARLSNLIDLCCSGEIRLSVLVRWLNEAADEVCARYDTSSLFTHSTSLLINTEKTYEILTYLTESIFTLMSNMEVYPSTLLHWALQLNANLVYDTYTVCRYIIYRVRVVCKAYGTTI